MEYKYKEHPDYNQIQVAKISWSTKKKKCHTKLDTQIINFEEEMKYSMQYSTCWKLEIQLSWQNEKIRSTVLIYVAKLSKMTNTSPQGYLPNNTLWSVIHQPLDWWIISPKPALWSANHQPLQVAIQTVIDVE